MPPHCDSLDGPVVRAARSAIAEDDVNLALPYVHAGSEDEVRAAFVRTMSVRNLSPQAEQFADHYFFETVVRLHRSGEGAPYPGLKPAGLDVGPVIPLAEYAASRKDPEPLIAELNERIRAEIEARMGALRGLEHDRFRSLADEREYVEAVLGLQVYSHRLYRHILDKAPH